MEFFKKKNYTVQICVRTTSNKLCPSVSVFGTDTWPNLFCMWFILLKWCDSIRPIHDTTLQSASECLFQVLGRIMLKFQLGDLPVRVHFGFGDNLALLLLVETSFTVRFVKRILQMECCIVYIRFCLVPAISEYKLQYDPLTALKNDLDTEISTEDLTGNSTYDCGHMYTACKSINLQVRRPLVHYCLESHQA